MINPLITIETSIGGLEEVVNVKEEVKKHFEDRFKEDHNARAWLENMDFKMWNDLDRCGGPHILDGAVVVNEIIDLARREKKE